MMIGLVGCGPWGANILRDLRTLGCEVFVARNPSSVARVEAGLAHEVVRSIRAKPIWLRWLRGPLRKRQTMSTCFAS